MTSSPKEKITVICDVEGLHLVTCEDGKKVTHFPVEGKIAWVGYTQDGQLLTAVVEDDILFIELRDHSGSVLSKEDTSRWNASFYQLTPRFSIAPNGRFILYSGGKYDMWNGYWIVNLLDRKTGEIRTWDLRESLTWLEKYGYIENLALRPDGKEIAIALNLNISEYPNFLCLNVFKNTITKVSLQDTKHLSVNDLEYSPDGHYLAVASSNGIYLIHDDAIQKLLNINIYSIAFSHDGKYLVALSSRKVYILKIEK